MSGLVFLAQNSNVAAQTNLTFNFQGKLVRDGTGVEGLNISDADTTCINVGTADDCDFRAYYYTASSGGTLLGDEVFSNIEVDDYNGIFNLPLGTGSFTGGSESSFVNIFL